MKLNLKKIEKLIEKGETKIALSEMRLFFDETESHNNSIYQSYLLCSSKFENLKKQKKLGIIDINLQNREFNEINYRILNMLQELRNEPDTVFIYSAYPKFIEKSQEKVELPKMSIELKINRDFNSFTGSEQDQFLTAIKELLKLNSDVKIVNLREGSVILTLEVNMRDGILLFEEFRRNSFSDYEISDLKITTSDIVFIKAEDSSVMMKIRNGQTYSSTENLGSFERALKNSDSFYRISRSYLINLHFVKTYNRQNRVVALFDETIIKIPIKKLSDFISEYEKK